MLVQTTVKHDSLQRALESKSWKTVNRILSSIPSCLLSHNNDPATITTSLEQVRAAADVLAQACDFGTAFESSFATRKALITLPSVLRWATEALKGFAFEERVVGRIAAMLSLLGMGSDGRAAVGCAGAVDQLTLVWRSHPTSVDVVSALVSLCSGHIDNVSRTMRRRGIATALQVLSDKSNSGDISLIQQVLIYIGLCAICTPDNESEARMVVPILLGILEDDTHSRRPQLLCHVIMALANIIDCWTKEGYGYYLGDPNRLADTILRAWESSKKSKDIASSASWALTAMLAREGTVQTALDTRFPHVKPLADHWKAEFKTAAFLFKTTRDTIRRHGLEPKECANRAEPVKSPCNSETAQAASKKQICDKTSSTLKRTRGGERVSREHRSQDHARKVKYVPRSEQQVCMGGVNDVYASPSGTVEKGNKSSTSTPQARRSKRRRIQCARPWYIHDRNNRYARRISVEVIEISSDTDEEQHSPRSVQDSRA